MTLATQPEEYLMAPSPDTRRKPHRVQPGCERTATNINIAVQHEFKDRLWQRTRVNGMGISEFVRHVRPAASLRRFIDKVNLYPADRLYAKAFIKTQKASLIESRFSKTEASEYCADNYPTKPKRQGPGNRGRYASRADIGRLFLITTKNDGVRAVYPNFDDPTTTRVNMVFGEV